MKSVSYLLIILLSLSSLVQQVLAKSSKFTDIYGALPSFSMMVMAPSGNRLAYRLVENESDVMVIFDRTQKKIIGGFSIAEINPNFAYFVDDNRLVFVASDNRRLMGYSGRQDVSVAYSYNLLTGNIKQLLIPGKGIYEHQSHIGAIAGLSADGEYVYMPAWESRNRFSLMKTHIDKKMNAKRVVKGNEDTIDFFMGPKDQVLAKERYNNETNKHSVQARLNGEWVEVFSEQTEYMSKSFVGFTADYKSLVLTDNNFETGRRAYYTMTLADGKITGPVFSRADKDVESVITDFNRVVHGVQYSGFKPSYEFFDNNINKIVSSVMRALPDNSLTIVNYTPDWSKVLFRVEGGNSAANYFVFEDNQLQFIASGYPQIKSQQVHQVVATEIQARDGLTIPTLLTLPKVKEAKSLPTVLLPHGGPEAYDRIGFDYMAQFFASQGYLVVQPQFRGSTGFGAEFTLKGRGEWGRKMQDDLTDTVASLVESGQIDPERVCIVGASYGGYAALAGATFTPDLYQCAVSINGVADLEKIFRDSKKKYGKNHWVVSYWRDVMADGSYSKDHLQQISPINHVDKVNIPVLLLHGENDFVVSAEQSEDMYDALDDADKKVKYVELEDGSHYLSKGKNRKKALKEVASFLSKHL